MEIDPIESLMNAYYALCPTETHGFKAEGIADAMLEAGEPTAKIAEAIAGWILDGLRHGNWG